MLTYRLIYEHQQKCHYVIFQEEDNYIVLTKNDKYSSKIINTPTHIITEFKWNWG